MTRTSRRQLRMALALLVALFATVSFGARRVSPKQIFGVVNINTASMSELDVLPGVGAKAAQKIIDYRKKTPFSRTEELVRVKGFGRKKYEKLKPFLTVSGPTTISDKSTSTQSTLRVTSTPAIQVVSTDSRAADR